MPSVSVVQIKNQTDRQTGPESEINGEGQKEREKDRQTERERRVTCGMAK